MDSNFPMLNVNKAEQKKCWLLLRNILKTLNFQLTE